MITMYFVLDSSVTVDSGDTASSGDGGSGDADISVISDDEDGDEDNGIDHIARKGISSML